MSRAAQRLLIVGTPRLKSFKAHFDTFPKVVGGQIVTS